MEYIFVNKQHPLTETHAREEPEENEDEERGHSGTVSLI